MAVIPFSRASNAQVYSALEHLAKALFVGRWKTTSWAFMSAIDYFTAYFDESRVDDGSPFPVVAGFCNTFDVWEVFEKKWKEASKHIPEAKIKKYFRVRPSPRNYPADEKRYRDSLVLAEVMRDYTLWPIHVSIERAFFQPTFDAVDKSANPFLSGAYAVCAFGCCELLDTMALDQKFKKEHGPIKVVFDEGNADERWLRKGYEAYYAQKPNTYLQKKAVFEDDEDLIPLRAADAYAWLLGRKYNHNEELEQLAIIHDPKNDPFRKELFLTIKRAQKILEVVNSANEGAHEV